MRTQNGTRNIREACNFLRPTFAMRASACNSVVDYQELGSPNRTVGAGLHQPSRRKTQVQSEHFPPVLCTVPLTAEGQSSMSTKSRVLVADSSRIHSQLLSEMLGRDSDVEIIPWDFDRTTIVSTAVAQDADMLALGSQLDGSVSESVAVIKEMRASKPATKVVVLLDSHQEEAVLEFLRAGAKGIFPREGSLEMLRNCLHVVNRGEIWLDNRCVSLVIKFLVSVPSVPQINAKGMESLTERECQVLKWMVQGLSNREISGRMELSPHTVKNYIFRIFDKMGVSSRAELLFLILSQSTGDDKKISMGALGSGPIDDHTLSMLSQEAEKGSPIAQLALARAYAARPDRPGNFSRAYKWYRIASERIARAHSALAKTMTPNELEESEREARLWLTQMNQAGASTPRSFGSNVETNTQRAHQVVPLKQRKKA
jgi:two-component system nitrate/nitrite response regulator NarL